MELAPLLLLPEVALLPALLLLTRLSALFVAAPIFGHAVVPVRLRAGMALLLTLLLLPRVLARPLPVIAGAGELTLALAQELAVGLVLGFVAMMFFHAAQFAGQQVSIQIGFAMPSIFDPTTRTQSSPIGTMFTLLATMSFLSLDAHHFLLAAFERTLLVVPLAGFAPSGDLVARVLESTTGVFDIALMLLLPALGMLLILEVVLAILNRVMPQFHIFSVSAGVKILLGLGILWLTVPLLGGTMDLLLERTARTWLELY